VGADAVGRTEGSTKTPDGHGCGGPTGVDEQGMLTGGSPGTWEAYSSPPRHTQREQGYPENKTPGLTGKRLALPGTKDQALWWYRRRRKRSQRDGRRGVGAPNSTDEAGELAPEDPA
jgi:hypothetical protein